MSQITEISLSKFRNITHHRKVKFVWTDKDGKKIKEFHSDKFYCNPYKTVLSLPKFALSKEQKWFQIDQNTFEAVSEYGKTIFTIEE